MPKPVLSDSLFNADDVATAVLNKANLSISNASLGVSDVSSIISLESIWSVNETDVQAYHFMGFVFLHLNVYTSSTVANQTSVATITDSNYYPSKMIAMPTVAYQVDTSHQLQINTNGTIKIAYPDNQGSSTYFLCCNGFYKI